MSNESKSVPPQADAQPVAWVRVLDGEVSRFSWHQSKTLPAGKYQLYTHADSGEVDRLKHEVGELEADVRSFKYGLDAMRAMLAERDSILSELRDDPRIWIMTSSDLCSRINSSLSTASPATINQQGEGE